MARMADLGSQLKGFYAGLSPGKRAGLVLVSLLGVGAVAAVAMLASRVEYAPLFLSAQDDEDVARTLEKLKERKVPFRIEGRTLLVPAADVERLRLELHGARAGAGASAGFELLDKAQIGRPESFQQLDYERALMGELARTIGRLSPVASARVHLVLPRRRLYSSRGEEASAAVQVALKSGQSLSREQVASIVHLVASSVKGLRPERVTLTDVQGRLLWKQQGGEHGFSDASEMDRNLERRASSLLEAVVGQGKALVRVSTELETQRREETINAIDPDSRVERTVQETQDSTSAGGGASGGVAGARANVGVAPTAPPTARPQGSARSSASRSFEMTRTVTRTVDPGGKIKKRSVAVLVDGKYETKDGKRVYVPRTPEEVKNLEDIVRGAVGFQAERGDVVTVRSIAFEPPAVTAGVEAPAEPGPPAWHQYARWGGIAAAVLLFFLFVVRPLMRAIAPPPAVAAPAPEGGAAEVVAGVGGAAAVAALGSGSGETVEIPSEAVTPREVARRLIEDDPRRAAEVIRGWMADKAEKSEAA